MPNIGSNDEFDENQNETVLSRFDYLKNIFKNNVSLIHGKMSDEIISKNMQEFQSGKNDFDIYYND